MKKNVGLCRGLFGGKQKKGLRSNMTKGNKTTESTGEDTRGGRPEDCMREDENVSYK